MQAETHAKIEIIQSSLKLLRKHVNFDDAQYRLEALEAQTTASDFWNDQGEAQRVMREKNQLERQLDAITSLQSQMLDAVDLIELGTAEGDDEIVAEAESILSSLVAVAEKRQLESLRRAKQTEMIVLLKFMQVRAAPRRRIGRRCCCECTPVGVTRAASKLK